MQGWHYMNDKSKMDFNHPFLSDEISQLNSTATQLTSHSNMGLNSYHTDDELHDIESNTMLTLTDWLILSFIKGVGPARLDRLKHYIDALSAEKSAEESVEASDLDTYPGPSNVSVTPLSMTLDKALLDKTLLLKLKWPEGAAQEAAAYLTKGIITDDVARKLEDTQAWLQEENHYLVSKDSTLYPDILKEIPVAPMLLYIEGSLEIFQQPKLGVVGARKCSAYGRDNAFHYAQALSSLGVAIVSGGALGVDSAAHMGALSVNAGTIAVMGAGLKNLYPKINNALYQELLVKGGAIVSEYPLHTPVKAHLFPPRNRIISGLSSGVFVVEASIKSGSLITAHYAVQHNRDVFALPGRTTDKQSTGTLSLIQQGAKLVTTIEDIVNELPELSLASYFSIPLNDVSSDGMENNGIESSMNQNQDPTKQNVSREILSKSKKNDTKSNEKESGNEIITTLLSTSSFSAVPWDSSLLEPCKTVIVYIDELLTSNTISRTFEYDMVLEGLASQGCTVSSSELSQAFIELELLGLIESSGTGYCRCYSCDNREQNHKSSR